MSKKKPDPSEDLFSSMPPQENFEAFPALDAFPEQAIAFLTGKATPAPEPTAPPTAEPLPAPDAPAPPMAAGPKPQTKPFSRPVFKPQNQPVNQPDSHEQNYQTPLSASQTVTHKTDLKTIQEANLSQSLIQDPSLNFTESQALSRSQSPFISHISSQSLLYDRLNANQRRVLDFLLNTRPYIIKFRDIALALSMREPSVRTILRRLQALGFLTFKKARDGNIQGVRLEFNQPFIEQYQQGHTISHFLNQKVNHTQGFSQDCPRSLSMALTLSQTPSPSTNHKADPQTPKSATHLPLKIERKDLSIEGEDGFGWDDAFLAMMWPAVHKVGFRVEQIRQAVSARTKLDKILNKESVCLSLDRADWELETTGRLTDLTAGTAVKNPPTYIFTALARWGVLRAHPDYVSREDVEAIAAVAEIKRRREAAEALEAVRFEA